MKLNKLNIVLALMLLLVVIITLFTGVDYSRPNYEIALFDDMTDSPAYDSYSANTVFADGQTWQPPVPGTIARDDSPLHFTPTPEGALEAGEILRLPFEHASDEGIAAVSRGRDLYRAYCVACHGAGGLGDGPVVERGFPPPPSLLAERARQMKEGQVFHILTYGQGGMAPFAKQLSMEQRWDLVYYLHDFQQQSSPEPPLDEPATEDAPEAEAEPAVEDEPVEDSTPSEETIEP